MTSSVYAADLFSYSRRPSREVMVGDLGFGGSHPIRVQSMITSDTMDTEACVQQTLRLVEVGCEMVRITAPTVKDAANLRNIREELNRLSCHVPLVADIHFKPEAALEAAKWVEKVRINPGNFADSKKFASRDYTDAEYAAEIDRIRERFTPLVKLCQERGVAMRIGTNHGSLSDRIMNRFGDSPLGMVESALEFARIARDLGYHRFVFSMKASNPKVMITAYRLLVARLNAEGPDWNYPIHLGVTEAGDGEDGRIKSAIGIGSLLSDGIGDTIRVSLTEDSQHEIPVARALIAPFANRLSEVSPVSGVEPAWDLYDYARRTSERIEFAGISEPVTLGGSELVRVVVPRHVDEAVAHKRTGLGDYQPELVLEDLPLVEVDPLSQEEMDAVNAVSEARLVTVRDGTALSPIAAFRLLASRIDARHPILLKDTLAPTGGGEFIDHLLGSATVLGSLLCDGIGDTVLLRSEEAPGQSLRLAYNILQAAGVRIFKTDYVACPSCGRTLFNLQETTARIKASTAHLKGVRIAIMGCIVNGPGEMADADFGYVGGAPGKVNLYVGKRAVKFNIPEDEALDRLVDLIKEHGRWIESVHS
ncbi:MAG: 4-hydroxy-3-methylbut-2-en-1-yl diphosphate synthase [Proteobacteria bacterium]|nr:4-hydroxy-3-methylbut-2-en-1-yl diphosphate synthase [Pseudomonadota bacterium]